MNISCASVPRSHRLHHHHQQQQSVALCGSPGSASAPPTPRSRQEVYRVPDDPHAVRSHSFRKLAEARVMLAYSAQSENSSMSSGSIGGQSDMETSSICSSAPSLSDVGEVSILPTTPQKSALRPPSGMRVHPLRLIAAVAAS
ncbi:unnamed protein product [Nippostrongylus brasiliensis]|uniref:Uncharacterized protein n=1 Tax=Nippostrongylus brasiliensis TaxID=27835 RepID=A0A0N4Y5N1_NIPBR|nr:unnamed protein product [Nippostrongylus brasiliensis]